ncbi:hypothetical protein BH23CHL1_BH23CHL1_24250 [soil metagenome]
MRQHWISALAERSLGNFEATADIDRRLSRLALDARASNESRDELFTLLATKVERFARRFRPWTLDPWEYDDVLQESYLIFINVVERWTPRYVDDEPAGFVYYFFAVYPLWLSTCVKRMSGRGARGGVIAVPLPEEYELSADSVSCEAEALTLAILDDVHSQLGEQAGALLHLRLVTGKSVTEAARQAGIPRRTAYRRWSTIVEFARSEWFEDKAGA